MFTTFKQFTTISLATLITIGAYAMSVESASALPRPGRGLSIGGWFNAASAPPRPGQSISISGGLSGSGGAGPGSPPVVRHPHGHWGHGYRWGAYAAPAYVSYAQPCYFVRRPAGLFKVCPVY